MKYFYTILICILCISVQGQQPIHSNVFSGKQEGLIFQGDATVIKNVRFELIQIKGRKSFKQIFKNKEGIVFIKQGTAVVQAGSIDKTLTPGSIAMITAGEKIKLKNLSNSAVQFYLFSYQAKDPMPHPDTCTSFIRIWEDLRFNRHERGGVRSYFSRATSQTKRFEMHVTTLLEGLPSHPPHTHNAEEIILVIEGDTEMEIDGKSFKGSAGDVYFVKSKEYHGIKNIGLSSCSYYAFQWE